MTNEQIVNEVYNLVAPLIEKMNMVEDTRMIEYHIQEITEDLTEDQDLMLDRMLEENGMYE